MNQTICVSIIIPCFERAKELQRLLASLKKMEFSEPWEIMVVDDGSKNHQAIKMVADEFSSSLIRLDNNVGPAEARNIGVKKAKGEFLWFLDTDTEVTDSHLLKTLVQCLRQNKSLAGVGGEAVKINAKLYAVNFHYLPNRLPLTKHIALDKSFEVHPKFIATNNLLVSKKDFLSVGGFSSFFNLFEDQDLCLRLSSNSGKSFLVRNDTCITHYHSPNGREGGKFWFYNKVWNYAFTMHVSRVKILFLHYPYLLPILPLLDIVFTPMVFMFQIFSLRMRCLNLFQKKSKKRASGSFPVFVLFNLIAMFLAWFMADILIVKSLVIGKKVIIEKK